MKVDFEWRIDRKISNFHPLLQISREKKCDGTLKAFWNALDFSHEPVIKWPIADRATAYQPVSRSCNLCLTEKLAILLAEKRTSLNKRSELTGKCWLKNKYKLKNVRP